MTCNPDIGRQTFFRALYSDGFIGKEDCGLPISGLGDDSTPADFVAWGLVMAAEFNVDHTLADPAHVDALHERWVAERTAARGAL